MKVKKIINNYKFIFVSSLLIIYLLTLFSMQLSSNNFTKNINTLNYKTNIIAVEDGTNSTKLAELRVENYSIGSFASNTLEYDIIIDQNESKLNILAYPEDPEAKVKITGNENISSSNGVVTITVTEPHSTTTVYKINYTRASVQNFSQDFSYTGMYETFVVPYTGKYKIQLWGAQGGNRDNGNLIGGRGGYTSGDIILKKGTKLYVYVGEQAPNETYNTKGGWNGGGNTPNGKDPDGRAGGGATDIRTIPTSTLTTWNEAISLRSRIMVAGGGGGGAYESSQTWSSSGGIAGGLTGYIPAYMGSSASGNYGRPGGQTSGGMSINGYGATLGGFGYGGQGYSTDGGSGGGGGWYGGGGSGVCSGGGGGSSYISGHLGCIAVDQDGKAITDKAIIKEDSYSWTNYTFENTVMIDGKGYEWTDKVGTTVVGQPTHDLSSTQTGNSGHGYAKITLLELTNTNSYLKELSSDKGFLSPTFNSTTYEYDLNLDPYDASYTITALPEVEEGVFVAGTGLYSIKYGEIKQNSIIVTTQAGDITIYKINVKRSELPSNMHSSKIADLEVIGYDKKIAVPFNKGFNSEEYNYDVTISYSDMEVDINAITFDNEATVKVTGNSFMINPTGTITVKVTEPHSSTTTYTINYTKEAKPEFETEFSYTGSYQVFEAPFYYGTYKFELWGAQGANYDNGDLIGGRGGYTSGELDLYKGEKLYIYVGQTAPNSASNLKGGWNGGGNTPAGKDKDGRAGGGATDIRTIPDKDPTVWNNPISLRSRIMVAGGGGGAAYESSWTWSSSGGAGGGLIGKIPTYMGSNAAGNYGTGGTQISGGYTVRQGGVALGSFGQGGQGYSTDGGSGGGGGWYGGGGSGVCSGGGGGSSYISGHLGCIAVTEEGKPLVNSTTNIEDSYSYTNYVFKNTKIIDGDGYEWTNTIATKADGQPEYGTTNTILGNVGNGHVKITPMIYSKNNYLASLEYDSGTLTPEFDPTEEEYDLYLDKYTASVTIDAIASDQESIIVGTGKYDLDIGETKDVVIYITAESGDTRTYTIHVTRRKLAPGEHSTKIATLDIENNKYKLTPEFQSEITTYTMEIPETIMSLNVETTLYDDESTVTITGNGYIKLRQNGLITITVSNPYVAPTIYKIEVIREGAIEQNIYEFDYKGEYQEFTAPVSGLYQLETWGAQGGGRHQNSELGTAGTGGYSTGTIYLAKGETVYIYVGGQGTWCGGTRCTVQGGWNGGGKGEKFNYSSWDPAASGGGATDIRLIKGDWNLEEGLNSRIIVAGGGGGGGMDGEWAGPGGGTSGITSYGVGGTQTTGYKFGSGCDASVQNGSSSVYGGPGGGGGWYGGYCRHWYGSGGGSGFILTEETIENTPSTYKVSEEYYLKDAETIAGNELMPSKNGGYTTGNTGNGYVRITKLEDPSENNFLQSITLRYEGEEKTYTPIFNAANLEYTAEFETTETEVSITAKPEDSKATIEGLGKHEVLSGTNVYPLTVTAENGDIKVYQVIIHRNADTNPYPNDIIINGLVPSLCSVNEAYCKIENAYGVQITGFNKDTHTYYVTVPSRIKQLYLVVEKGHPYQNLNGEGKVTLKDGTETYTVTVSAENIDEIENPVENVNYTRYNFVITKDMTGDNDLEELLILDPERDINFNPDILEYYLSVPNNYTTFQVNENKIVDGEINEDDSTKTYPLQLFTKTDDPNATLTITDPYEFNVGMNQINVSVTAQNGEIKVYILNVYREQNENVFLKYITVTDSDNNNYDLNPTFNKINTGEYIVTVPNNVISVNINAEAEYNKTIVTGTGTKELLTTKTNKFVITTTSESGIIENYNVSIIREKNNNDYLSNIKVYNDSTNYELNPIFDKDTLDYEIDVEEGVNSISIEATPEVNTTKIRLLDNSNIRVGTNIKRVMSIAEDGTSKIYTIKINRPASSNNNLTSLIIKDNYSNVLDYLKVIDNTSGFDKDITDYKITVPNDISSITISATKENNLSSIVGTGKHSLKVGTNTISIKVTSESGIEKTYTITIDREPNNNTYLKSITTSEGIIVPTFDKEKNTYSIDVENDIESIIIIGTPEVTTSKVTGNGTYNLESGNNEIKLIVTSEDNSTREYIINVYRDKSENDNIKYLIMKEGAITPSFDSNVIYYEANVPYEITNGTFIVELEDTKASYVINGNNNFNVGNNTVTITVTSESGLTKDYTVVVNRQSEETSTNYLLNITTSEGILNPVFDKQQLYYEIEVPYEVTKITFNAEKESDTEHIIGTGTYSLNVGKNLSVIKVTSADGLTRDYQIITTRKPNTDARLQALTINGAILSPNFNKDIYEYTTTTTDTSLDFTNIVPYDSNATYEVLNNILVTGEEKIVTIRVTAADKTTTKDYNIKVTKNPSNNNNLFNLEVENFNIQPSFNKITTLYNLVVPNDVNNINIIAIPENPLAQVNGDGIVDLKAGENQLIVEVLSESGNKKAYTIVVTREASSNNLIEELNIENGLINQEFNPYNNEYNVIVPYDVDVLDLNIKLQDPYATYKVENNDLHDKNNQVRIIVTAQNGTTNIYKLNVTKQNIVSALLKRIDVKNYHLTPNFNSYINSYTFNVDNEIESLNLEIETIDSNATYTITGNENFKIGLNIVTIEVTASDNTTKETYTLYVNKQPYANSFMDYIYTDQGDLQPLFNKYTMEYSLDVSNSITEIEIFGEPVDKSTTVTGLGVHNLSKGKNIIPITVTTQSGITRTYYITINRALSDDNKLTSLNVKVGSTKYVLSPEFDSETKNYTVTVPTGTKNIILNGTISDNATVTGLGTIPINAGINNLEIVVTSESGIDNVYSVIVNRPLSSNAELTELTPSVGTLEPLFGYGITNYVLNLDSGAATLSFAYAIEDLNSTVKGYESKVIPDGVSIREIEVTAEDGTKKTYTITINKERTDNAKLSELYIKNYPFTSIFDPDTYSYYVTVPNDKKTIKPTDVIATPQDKNSKVIKSTELSLSTTTQNEFTVTVTAPDGFTKQDYKIYINREKGSNVSVTNIIPNIGYFEEKFKSDRLEYTWKVPKGTTEITSNDVTVLLDDDSATIVKTQKIDMKSSDKTFIITVTSEDGNTTYIYNLNIEYEYSANAYLSSLSVDKGYYEPEFKEDLFEYHVYEYENVNEISINTTLSSDNSTVTGDGLVELNEELTTRNIVVTAEDGSTETYIIYIHKNIKTDEGLNDLFLNGLDINLTEEDEGFKEKKCIGDKCILSPEFDSEIISYDIKVPFEYTSLDVYTETKNDQQTTKIKINDEYVDNYTLPLGITKAYIEVYDGMNKLTRTYTLNVNREQSNNTYLKSLEVDGYVLEEMFDKHVQEYTVYVGKNTDAIDILAEPEEETSKILLNGYNYLDDGENDATIEVIAKDGSSRTYILHIIKSSTYNNKIKIITVSTGVFHELTPKFKPTTTTYTVTVPSIYSKVTVEAAPLDPSTIIAGTGEYEIVTGNNQVTLTSTSPEDGEITIYTINIIKEASENVDLKSLIIEEGNLNPLFDKGVTKYETTVDPMSTKLTIHAIPDDPSSTVKITGNENLRVGKNIINIIVTTEDKSSSKTYQVTVNKLPSENNYLSDLKVTNDENIIYNINPIFNKKLVDYDLTVPYEIEKVIIKATPEDENATMTGIGEEYLDYGLNLKQVTVTSESGTIKVYNIYIYRNYDLRLKDIVSDEGTLTPEFDSNKYEYKVNVPNEVDEITFVALKYSNKTTVTGSGTYNLNTGDNEIIFTVNDPDDNFAVYKVIVNRAEDDNNYIKELTVDGIMNPVFNKEVQEYNIDVRNNITSLSNLNYILESKTSSAIVLNNNSFSQSKNPNKVIIKVTSESGLTREYILNVMLRNDDFFSNRLSNLTINNGKLTPDFNPDINNYAVTVSNSVSELNITTTPENERATVTGDGKIILNIGRNVIPITVTSQDGRENIYNLVVYRNENNDATLQSLIVTGQNYIPLFSKLNEDYAMSVGSEINKLDIIATPTDSESTVKIVGNNNLVTGENIIKIIVTAPDKITTKTYTMKVTKSISKNNYIKELNVSGYTFTSPYIKTNQGPYTINVPSNVNSVVVNAIPEVDTTSITGDGINKLNPGKNIITIKAVAESGDTRIYTIIVNKALSTDSTLKNILLSDESLDPEFNPSVREYTVKVPEELESITITGILNDSSASIVGNGTYDITEDFTINLIVTAEDGNKTTYKVNIVRDIPASSFLKSLIVKDGELYPGFHKLITSYTILVPNEIRSLNMTYLTEDPNANVIITGNENFKVGTNKVNLVVTATDGSQTTYTISAIRQSIASNYLKTLSVDGYTLTPMFDKTILYYETTVPMETDMIKIKAQVEDPTSTLTGTGYVSVKPGNNKYYVTVESASGVIRTYQIAVNRTESSENYLLSLNSDVGTIKPIFDKEIHDYEIEVPEKTEQITLSGTASDNSKINGLGTYEVSLGETTRIITVTSQNGDINTYTVKVIKKSSSNTELIDLTPSIGTLDYSNDKLEYNMEVEDNINVISFQAIPVDKDAIVTTDDIMVLNYGENTYHIKVVAEDGVTERNIEIKINRKKDINKIETTTHKVFIDKGDKEIVKYIIEPNDTSYPDTEWISDNESIATISNDGEITGIDYGSTTIRIVSKHDSTIFDTINVTVMSKKIISEYYNIYRNELEEDNNLEYIIGLDVKTSVSNFISKLDNEETMLSVYDLNNNKVDKDAIIGTGCKVQLIYEDTVLDELTIIVRGDLTGDGQINNTDYVKMKNYILKKTTFNEIEMKAGDLTQSNSIVTTDYVKMKNYILKKITSVN